MNKTKTKKKENLYFKNYDLYSDANPKDTIRIKYKTLQDVKDTINKLEKLYKSNKYKHNKRYKLSKKYFEFLKNRTKEKDDKKRKMLNFKI